MYFFKMELKVIANTSQKIEYILVDHSLYINKRLSYNLVNIKKFSNVLNKKMYLLKPLVIDSNA